MSGNNNSPSSNYSNNFKVALAVMILDNDYKSFEAHVFGKAGK